MVLSAVDCCRRCRGGVSVAFTCDGILNPLRHAGVLSLPIHNPICLMVCQVAKAHPETIFCIGVDVGQGTYVAAKPQRIPASVLVVMVFCTWAGCWVLSLHGESLPCIWPCCVVGCCCRCQGKVRNALPRCGTLHPLRYAIAFSYRISYSSPLVFGCVQ